jgi:hypothetical protein
MKSEKPLTPDDIELVPDSWEVFKEAVRRVAKHPPIDHPTGHGKQQSKPKKRPATRPR